MEEDKKRKPSEKVFNDIKQAAELVWLRGHYHQEYEDEKVSEVMRIQNYADNWSSIIGMFDSNNQIIFFHYLKYKESVDFLRCMTLWYHLNIPRDKV